MATETSALAALSNDIATTVERAGASVVAVEARARLGSTGFYVRPNLVLTADHALESDDVEIVAAGGTTESGTIVGRDPSTDLALVRTLSPGVPLSLAPNNGLRVGAIALAVARDDDGDLAASMGVISAVGGAWRTWHGGEIDRFVRPDLSLYPRFAGSPLLDVDGNVLGLNTSGLSRRQTLTIPASTIDRVVNVLLARGGRIPRGYLGVHLQAIPSGVIILGIERDGPADRGGLIVGDVITAIGGEKVSDVGDVHARLGPGSVGTTLTIDVLRGGAPTKLDVAIGERKEREE
ncbi:MAG TPA: S1C family serine protease [Candidatus Acidoferrum sp.]|nr:S1C family serine protease [Candidatus Acidoferrum sp.]